MNEPELIYKILEDLNRRLSYLEMDDEGEGANDKEARELLVRLSRAISERTPSTPRVLR